MINQLKLKNLNYSISENLLLLQVFFRAKASGIWKSIIPLSHYFDKIFLTNKTINEDFLTQNIFKY